MQMIEQQALAYFGQISAYFPGVPTSMLLFFLVVAAFLALVLFFSAIRLLWGLMEIIFGVKKRKRARGADPQWERTMRLRALRQQHHWQREDYY